MSDNRLERALEQLDAKRQKEEDLAAEADQLDREHRELVRETANAFNKQWITFKAAIEQLNDELEGRRYSFMLPMMEEEVEHGAIGAYWTAISTDGNAGNDSTTMSVYFSQSGGVYISIINPNSRSTFKRAKHHPSKLSADFFKSYLIRALEEAGRD